MAGGGELDTHQGTPLVHTGSLTAEEQEGCQSEFPSSPCPQVERNPRTTLGTPEFLSMTSPDPQSTLRPLYSPAPGEAGGGGGAADPKGFIACELPGGMDSHLVLLPDPDTVGQKGGKVCPRLTRLGTNFCLDFLYLSSGRGVPKFCVLFITLRVGVGL